jgi:hypothetical protein
MTSITKKSSSGVIELNCHNNARVKVVPADKNVMMLTVRAAIEACRAYDEQLQFNDQFEHLLPALGAWLSDRKDKVDRAYLTVAETGLMFLVMLKDVHYDSSVEDELTEFDLQIANDVDFSLLRISMLAIPQSNEDALQAFLDPERAVPYTNAK